MKKQDNGPDPWAFTKTTHATKFRHLDVIGWGGGPGLVWNFTIDGLMTVDLHDSGLLHIILEEDCTTTERYIAEWFGASDKTIPKGNRLYVHPKQIRSLIVANGGK